MEILKKIFNREENDLLDEEVAVIAQLYEDYINLLHASEDVKLRNEVGNNFIVEATTLQRKNAESLRKIIIRQSAKSRSSFKTIYYHPQFLELEDSPKILEAKIQEVRDYVQRDNLALKYKELFNRQRKTVKLVPIHKQDKKEEYISIEDMQEIKTVPIGSKFDRVGKLSHYVVIDVKTTGERASDNVITEIAAIKVVEDVIVEGFFSGIDPFGKSNPRIGEIADSFMEFVGNSPIVGYYVSLDLKFLFSKGMDLIDNRKVYDVVQYIKKLKPRAQSYELEDIFEDYKYAYIPKDSLDKCLMINTLFEIVLDKIVGSN